MTYRTQQAVQSLFELVEEEPINELLHLTSYMNMGWPDYEIKRCVALFRTLLSTPNSSIEHLVEQGFPHTWTQEVLALLNLSLPPEHSEPTCHTNLSIAMLFLSQQGYVIKRINKHTGRIWVRKHDRQFQFELKHLKYKKQNMCILLGLS
ncbi:hypothetical protein [Vibrio sp. B1Z05]